VHLKAYYEGNNSVIEIIDDGKGMDSEVIKQKGIEKGLITKREAKRMTKVEGLNLIFTVGFSTAENVSSYSGRGVGMDVVKTNINKLKGVVELDSNPGLGSRVKIKLPLTLALLEVLEIVVASENFLLPLESVVKIIELTAEELITVQNNSQYSFQKENVPVLELDIFLVLKNKDNSKAKEYLIIVGQEGERIGLLVENIIQQHEVLVKPISKMLDSFKIPHLQGVTIMGNGSVSLILDAGSLAKVGADQRRNLELEKA